jgi:hypothetical protein
VINLHDIQTAVAALLQSAGHTVTAAEITEGFNKPTFFIDVFSNSVTPENAFMALHNVGVELRYFPDIETREAQVIAADTLRVLLALPLAVKDRFLTIGEITFDTNNSALLCYFELEFYNEIPAPQKEYDKIQNLEVKLNYGTSSGSN